MARPRKIGRCKCRGWDELPVSSVIVLAGCITVRVKMGHSFKSSPGGKVYELPGCGTLCLGLVAVIPVFQGLLHTVAIASLAVAWR